MKIIFITFIVLSALGLIHARPASQSNFNQEEVKALIQTLIQSEDYQDTGADELGSQNRYNFNALSLEDKTASNQIFGLSMKLWAIKKIFNRKFRNAMFTLFKPCVCGREELVKEQQSDDDDDYGAKLMQDDEPDGGMNAEAEGRRFSFYRMKRCVLEKLRHLPGLALKYAG